MGDPAAPRTPDSAGRRPPGKDQGQGVPRRAAFVMLTRSVLVTAGLVAAYYLLPLDGGTTATTAALLALGLAGVALLFAWEVMVIAHSPYPRLKAVEALSSTLPLFLLLSATAYYLLDRAAPRSFSEPLTRTDSLYFTVATFATVGYGDITARSQTARVLTTLQMVGGLLLVGVAARVLASAVQAGLRQQRGRPPE
ncbi:metal transporter [Streptomyces sp. NTH33]|uniref:potassium channel family protein n=1 Tax=Streptomyces sp. NTH33 TaxID=1735453 RepID=UPI000DA6E39F|nr:potassium channel family protein [Streptomyces sp. NTH33]PZH18042.1 metal transporter [Streptomyces sp. NTH33]